MEMAAGLLRDIGDGVLTGVGDDDVGAGWVADEQAASADPAPTASTATLPACRIDRRETALAMSPKYSLSLRLGTGFEQASPHLNTHVTCWRRDFPSWLTNRFNGRSVMNSLESVPARTARTYDT